MFKMDKRILEIMADEIGIEINKEYCPFKDIKRCIVGMGFCETKVYEGCSAYNARVSEIIKEWRDEVKQEERLVAV